MPGADDGLPADLARLLHDLRGPLNSLTMHAEVLKRTVHDDALATDSLRTLLEQLARLSTMLPAAFSVAGLELGPRARVDLGAVVAKARAQAGGEVIAEGGAPPEVEGDEALLTLALEHLLRNAVESAGAQPPRVRWARAGDQVRVSVRDWGPGLRSTNPKQLIRLMHSTKPGHRGLGLVTVDRIARLHGGALTFEAASPGAVVTLSLPV